MVITLENVPEEWVTTWLSGAWLHKNVRVAEKVLAFQRFLLPSIREATVVLTFELLPKNHWYGIWIVHRPIPAHLQNRKKKNPQTAVERARIRICKWLRIMKKGIRALCKLMKTRNPLVHSLHLCDFTPNSKTQRAGVRNSKHDDWCVPTRQLV